jgi:hypothetical protein
MRRRLELELSLHRPYYNPSNRFGLDKNSTGRNADLTNKNPDYQPSEKV